jgi:hypothetical protein
MKRIAAFVGLKPLLFLLGGTTLLGFSAHVVTLYQYAYLSASSTTGAQKVVQAALFAESYMLPQCFNTGCQEVYNPADNRTSPISGFTFQQLAQLFQGNHQANDKPDQVECVGFVVTSFAMAGYTLPPIPNPGWAVQYWQMYASKPGWQEIPSGSGPALPGDIMVMKGENDADHHMGHVAIVVAVNPPANGTAGSIVVAQGNAPGNFVTPDPRAPGVPAGIELYALPYSSNYVITSTWSHYAVLGTVRNLAAQTVVGGLPAAGQCPKFTDISGPNVKKEIKDAKEPLVTTACQAAQFYARQDNLPNPTSAYFATYFARQIHQESDFNRDSVSSAGAIGIAQFLPTTAATKFVVDPKTNKLVVVDPHDPTLSLLGGAKMMADAFNSYLGADKSPRGQLIAYMKALAAYNCGGGCVASRERLSDNWGASLPNQTRDYIYKILVPVVSPSDQLFIQSFVNLKENVSF